MIESHDLEF